ADQRLLWVDKYAPDAAGDLCVHARKLGELRQWLARGRGGVLIVSGPAGSAKSTSISVLASELQYSVVYWNESFDLSSHAFTVREQSRRERDTDRCVDRESRLASFRRFLSQSQRYGSLAFGSGSRKLVVVDELPLLAKPAQVDEFRTACRSAFQASRFPIIFVLTSEFENRQTAQRVFGSDLLASPNVAQIRFNAVSATGMRKALRRVADGEGFLLGKDAIERIVAASNGDVRSAIHQLQFDQVACTDDGATVEKDMGLSVCHALGKVLYGKVSHVDEFERIIERCDIGDGLFCEHLHENYLRFLKMSVEAQRDTASAFSDADLMSQAYGRSLPSYASVIGCLAYSLSRRRDSTSSPPPSWQPLRSPLSREMRIGIDGRKSDLRDFCRDNPTQALQTVNPDASSMWTDTLPYMALIMPPNRLLYHIRSHKRRLGMSMDLLSVICGTAKSLQRP
ncbi:hypothetical protein PBRA_006870, partial [Plasmodiophora brassicae]